MIFNPSVVKANGYVVPDENMEKPEVLPASIFTRVLSGKPTVIYTNINEFPAGIPTILLAGIPRTNTPGQDSFLIPKQVPATNNSFVAGIPEVEIAKDAYIKDQNPQNFSTFGKYQGLKYSSVHCQLEDKDGNLWFGTYGGGVSKFDGKSFTHFTMKEGLSNNRVWSVMQDNSGNFWFGTDGGGVSKYDGKKFTNYTQKEGLVSNSVLAILQDKDENIWFATVAGVSKYDGKTFTNYTTKEGLCDNTVLSILQDKNGDIWFGTGESGLSKFDGKTFANYTKQEGLVNNTVLSILQDRKGNLWFGTYGGVSKFDGKYFTNYTEKEGLSNNIVFTILQDTNGAFWFATGGGGVSKLVLNDDDRNKGEMPSRDMGQFTHYTTNEGLCNDMVYSILQDRCNNLWFGTIEGVSKYEGKLFNHFTETEGLSNNKVYCILKDTTGNLWFGTYGGGVSKYDGKSFVHYTEREGLSNNRVFSILQDKSGNLWFGTDGGGVSKFDGKYFTRFSQKEGLSNNKVFCILQDKTGNIWFGTYGGGVSKYDGKYFTNFTTKEGLCNNYVVSIFQDSSQNIWIGTDGGGVSELVPDQSEKLNGNHAAKELSKYRFINFTTREGLSNNYVSSISQDKSGNIWFGTGGGGVLKYDGKYFTCFTEKEGLSNDYVLSILQDKSNNIWFGTRFGLSRLNVENIKLKVNNPELPLFTNYGHEDGFLGIGCTRGAMCQDNSGTIWIGTNDRLTAYHPEGDLVDTIPPNMQLTGIRLFNENISWTDLLSPAPDKQDQFLVKDTSLILGNGVIVTDFKFDGTSKWYDLPQNLSLKYNNNFLTFTFIGITQKQSKKVKYKYQLEGADNNWSALTPGNEASYGNLFPGKYIFKVKAINSEGRWSKESAYSFTIRPPWWKTGWFRLFVIVFIVGSLFVFYRWRINSLTKRQKYLERIVKEKTMEVVTQSKKLQSINNELMLQKAELEIANATKDKFFSIIAHDLRSPFNGFLGLTEIMAEESSSLTTAALKKLALSMNRSATNLYLLLENLLQWSQFQKEVVLVNQENFHLRTIVNECLTVMIEPAKNKEIEIVNDIPDGLVVYADGNMLQTIVRNLVSNAVKFTLNGGLITINAKPLEDNIIEISVMDSGIGMNKDLLSRLFRIDEKVSRKGTNDEPSTGLGLILCKEFVEKHDGRIWAESEPGNGSTFYFTIRRQLQSVEI